MFAKAVNDLHAHLVDEKKVEMFMWGDRLRDSPTMGYDSYEASTNGTSGAVDEIPKDIVICGWHYSRAANYKSIAFLLGK